MGDAGIGGGPGVGGGDRMGDAGIGGGPGVGGGDRMGDAGIGGGPGVGGGDRMGDAGIGGGPGVGGGDRMGDAGIGGGPGAGGGDKSAEAGKDGGVVPGKEGLTDFGAAGKSPADMGGGPGAGHGAGHDAGIGGGPGAGGDSMARMLPFEPTSDLQDIFFKFDKYDLDDNSKDALRKNAQWLKEHANVRVEIQGHCDERGTNNYNLGLGERRALSAKKYLMALGVDKDRLFTISYGEERPFCRDSNEECWARNRRAHFLIAR
jgi:peptidoglycan-associated lipoprotein